jgi:hypothetical protein
MIRHGLHAGIKKGIIGADMKWLTSKTSFLMAILVALSFFVVAAGSQSSIAHASAAADQKAAAQCADKLTAGTNTQNPNSVACQKGFVAGYDGTSDKTATCKRYSGSVKADCEDGFDTGKSTKAKEPADAGKAGAAANPIKSKNVACAMYSHDATSKKICEKGYDDQITAMAKSIGKNAAEAGQADPCAHLGFGGTAAKKDCETYFQKGQNQLGKSPNSTCGGVATYFDFRAICAGYNEKQGGGKNPIIAIALAVVGWITALVGVAVVGGIVFGGFLYTTARDNASQTQKGITIIVNSVVALIAWTFAYVVINFIVPGGLFH